MVVNFLSGSEIFSIRGPENYGTEKPDTIFFQLCYEIDRRSAPASDTLSDPLANFSFIPQRIDRIGGGGFDGLVEYGQHGDNQS